MSKAEAIAALDIPVYSDSVRYINNGVWESKPVIFASAGHSLATSHKNESRALLFNPPGCMVVNLCSHFCITSLCTYKTAGIINVGSQSTNICNNNAWYLLVFSEYIYNRVMTLKFIIAYWNSWWTLDITPSLTDCISLTRPVIACTRCPAGLASIYTIHRCKLHGYKSTWLQNNYNL